MQKHRKLAALALSVMTLSVMAISCGSDGGGSSADDASASSTTTSTDSGDNDSGDTDDGTAFTAAGPIELSVGERATIELDANPTTGYQWELSAEPDPGIVRVVSDHYEAAPSDVVGSGGTQRIVIEGVAGGSATIDLRYVRPWESDQPPAETASFPVTVA